MQYNNFKEFYWKRAVWILGIPWGLMTGIIVVIIQNKEVLSYFTRWTTLIQLLVFVLAGFPLAYTTGKALWKRGKAYEEQKARVQN